MVYFAYGHGCVVHPFSLNWAQILIDTHGKEVRQTALLNVTETKRVACTCNRAHCCLLNWQQLFFFLIFQLHVMQELFIPGGK